MKPLEANVLQKVKQMLHQGKSTRKVSRELKISQSSVMNIRKEEDLSRVRVKCGRPSMMTERDARGIGRAIAAGKARTPKEAARMNGVQGSVWTVRRALKKIGRTAVKKSKKTKLSQKHKASKG